MDKYCGILLLLLVCILATFSVASAAGVTVPFSCYACHFKPTPVSGIKPDDDGTPDCEFRDNRGPQTFKTKASNGETMCYTKTVDETGFIKRDFVDFGTSPSTGCSSSEEMIDGKSLKVKTCYCDSSLCNVEEFVKNSDGTGDGEEDNLLWYISGAVGGLVAIGVIGTLIYLFVVKPKTSYTAANSS